MGVRVAAVAATVLALLVALPLGGAASEAATSLQAMTVVAAPNAARARAVRLTITLRYEMQCSYPGVGPLVVTFPSAVKLPKRFAAGSVRLSGKAIAAKIKRRRVTVTIPPPQGSLCTTIGPGVAKLTFTHAAKIANPAAAGSYRFTATHAKHTFRAKLVVKPAA